MRWKSSSNSESLAEWTSANAKQLCKIASLWKPYGFRPLTAIVWRRVLEMVFGGPMTAQLARATALMLARRGFVQWIPPKKCKGCGQVAARDVLRTFARPLLPC